MSIKLPKFKPTLITILFLMSIILKFDNRSTLFEVISLVIFLLYFIRRPKKNYITIVNVLRNNKLIFIAYLTSIMSTLIAVIRINLSINYLFELFLFGILTMIGTLCSSLGEDYLKRAFSEIIFVMFLLSILGVVESLTGSNQFVQLGLMSGMMLNGVRITSAFGHPIFYSIILVCAFVLTFVIYKPSIYKKSLLILFAINILLTQSRSSWFSMLLFFIIILTRKFIIDRGKIRKRTIILIMIGLPAIFLFFYKCGLINVIIDRFNLLDSYDLSTYQRTATIVFMLKSFFDSNLFQILFGSGSHAAASKMLTVTFQWQGFTTTDNLWVSDLINYGIMYVLISTITSIKAFHLSITTNDKIAFLSSSIFLCMVFSFFFYEPFVCYCAAFLFFFNLGLMQTKIYNQCDDNTKSII